MFPRHRLLGVRYHILAGHPAPFTCSAQAPGDGVVTLESALATSSPVPQFTTTATTTSLIPTAMTFDAGTFSGFVAPLLAARVQAGAGLGSPQRWHRSAPGVGVALRPDVQQVLAEVVPVGSGQTVDVPVYVDGDSLAVVIAAPDSVTLALHDPAGSVRAEIAAGSGGLFRTLGLAGPDGGVWTARVRNTGTTAAEAQVAVRVRATPLRMRLAFAADPGASAVTVRASLADGAAPALGATINVRLIDPAASTTFAALFDDGAHEDGQAGDGVYAARIENVEATDYAVVARAVYDRGGATPQQRFAHAALDLDPARFADVSATYTTEVRRIPWLGTGTFKLDVRNDGPARAVAVHIEQRLPEDTGILGARTSTGETCVVEEARVTCGIAAIAPNTTSVVWVDVDGARVGDIVAEATVTAFNVDPALADNEATDTITVATGASTEDSEEAPVRTRLHAPAPNPGTGTVGLAFETPAAQRVEIIVYDALGRRRAVLWDRWTASGHHIVPLDVSDWPGGVYVIRLQAGSAAQSQPLVVVR